jgi:formyl-CoA transferase
MTTENGVLPLSRFTVLDLTRVRSGPTCVRQLADWGANVIKIELPEALEGNAGMGGPRHGPDFQNLHRNKRSMTLNLKAPEGLEVFKRLVAKADVVVENYRPDVKSGSISRTATAPTRRGCAASSCRTRFPTCSPS